MIESGAKLTNMIRGSMGLWLRFREIGTVSCCLYQQKNDVKANRSGREKDFLHGRKSRARHGSSEVRQNQTEDTQRHDGIQISAGSLQIVLLFTMPQTAQEQRQPDQAVQCNHNYGKHHVASERRVILPVEHRR